MLLVRKEIEGDESAVRRVNELAFGGTSEAVLVDALRKNPQPHISLVAELDGEVVGHIFFSPVRIESDSTSFTALGLAPMAVLPELQNRGIGSELVRQGLKACFEMNEKVVLVLGHPEFYPRFGFVPAKSKGLSCEYPVPDEVFMVAELEEGALSERVGLVKYSSEFNNV